MFSLFLSTVVAEDLTVWPNDFHCFRSSMPTCAAAAATAGGEELSSPWILVKLFFFGEAVFL